jgi:hypothetical protein
MQECANIKGFHNLRQDRIGTTQIAGNCKTKKKDENELTHYLEHFRKTSERKEANRENANQWLN